MTSRVKQVRERVGDIAATGLGALALGVFISVFALEEGYRRYSELRAKVSNRLRPVSKGCKRHIAKDFERDRNFVIQYPKTGKSYLFHVKGLDRATLLGEVVNKGRIYTSYKIFPGDYENPLGGLRTGGKRTPFWDYIPTDSDQEIKLPTPRR